MSHAPSSDEPGPPALPIGEIFAVTYRHIWRYRWPYLGQVAIWTVMMWLRQYPVLIISDVLERVGLVWLIADLNLISSFVADATKLLFLMLGGGLIFLSSGCAILFERRPRAGDALRLPAVKGFWFTSFLFWVLADSVGVVALHVLFLYVTTSDVAPHWLTPYAAQTGYLVYPVVVWALIALALPIVAFEHSAMPFREAWERLRDYRPNVLALFALVAAPIVAPQVLAYLTPLLILASLSMYSSVLQLTASPGAFPLIRTALFTIGILLSYLLILALSVSTTLVYRRLSPKPAEIARAFD